MVINDGGFQKFVGKAGQMSNLLVGIVIIALTILPIINRREFASDLISMMLFPIKLAY